MRRAAQCGHEMSSTTRSQAEQAAVRVRAAVGDQVGHQEARGAPAKHAAAREEEMRDLAARKFMEDRDLQKVLSGAGVCFAQNHSA